jgi:hypothetical protein
MINFLVGIGNGTWLNNKILQHRALSAKSSSFLQKKNPDGKN